MNDYKKMSTERRRCHYIPTSFACREQRKCGCTIKAGDLSIHRLRQASERMQSNSMASYGRRTGGIPKRRSVWGVPARTSLKIRWIGWR